MSCAIGGCGNKPTILASGWWQAGGIAVVPAALAIDSSRVYWTGEATAHVKPPSPGVILSCAIGGCGCAPTAIASNVDDPTGVAVANDVVYLTQYSVGLVGSCSAGGCGASATNLASSQVGPTGIVVDATGLYWTNTNGGLMRCTLPDCAGGPTKLWAGQGTEAQTTGLAVDAVNLYWTNGNPGDTGSVFQCAKSNCAAAAMALASGRNSPRGIAVDGTDVYWSDDDNVYKCAIGGCNGAPTLVGAGGPAVALDATHVYATGAGQIFVIDK